MKRLYMSLGLVVMSVAALFASNPMTVKYDRSNDRAEAVLSPRAQVSVKASDAQPVSVEAAAAATTANTPAPGASDLLSLFYNTPGALYFPVLCSEDLEYNIPPARWGVVAPNCDLKYRNGTVYYSEADGEFVSFNEEDANDFTWYYGVNNAFEEIGFNFEYNYSPNFLRAFYGYNVPSLVYGEDMYVAESNGYPLFIYSGQSGYSQADFDEITEINSDAGVEFNRVVYSQYNIWNPYTRTAVSGNTTYAPSSYTGIMALGTDDVDGANATIAKSTGFDASKVMINQMVQRIPTGGASIALKNITFMVAAEKATKAKSNSIVYKLVSLNENGVPTDNVLYEQTLTNIEIAGAGYFTVIDLPFTYDDGVEELDYLPVTGDCALIVEQVTGFKQFCPALTCFYCNEADGELSPVPNYAAIGFEYDGDQYYINMNRWIFSNSTLMLTSVYTRIEMEFTYLTPDYNYSTQSDIDYNADGYDVTLANGDEQLMRLCFPGSIEDIMISQEDGNDLPDWLEVFVEDFDDEVLASWTSALGADEQVEAASCILGIKANGTPSPCTVMLNYKGAKALFKINGGGNGIEAVGSSAAEVSAEMFDLQGRRLTVEPENGVYLRRSTLSDGTVCTSKVVR